jgi:hypothetical protein
LQRIYHSFTVNANHTVFFSKPSYFLAIILQLPTQFYSSVPKHITWQAGVSKLDSAELNCSLNHCALTTQKAQPLSCCEGVFTAPLHTDRSNSIFVCPFVAAGMCLPSRCLAGVTIPAFGRHVTVFKKYEFDILFCSCNGYLACVFISALYFHIVQYFLKPSSKFCYEETQENNHTLQTIRQLSSRLHVMGIYTNIHMSQLKVPSDKHETAKFSWSVLPSGVEIIQ